MRVLRTVLFLVFFLSVGAMMSTCGYTASASDAGRETEDFDFANGLLARGMYDLAASAYDDYLEKYPRGNFVEAARYRKAESFFLAKKYKEALKEFQSFLESKPSGALEAEAFVRSGQILYEEGQTKRAAANFNKALLIAEAEDNSKETAEYYLAEMILKEGSLEKAREAFEKFIEERGGGTYFTFAALHLGDIYVDVGEYQRAAKIYEKAGRTAEGDLSVESFFRAADAYFKAGDEDSAIDRYQALLRDAEGDYTRDRAALGLISVHYNLGNNSDVIEKARAFIPGITDKKVKCRMRLLLANSNLNVEEFQSAEEVYNEIILSCDIPQLVGRARLNKCWTLYNLKDYERCLEEADAYLAEGIKDNIDEALYLRAKTFSALNRWQEAISQYDQLIEEHGDSDLKPEVLYDKGWAHYRSGDRKEGARIHKIFVKNFPEDGRRPELMLMSAQSDLESGEYEEAVHWYEEFIKDYPGSDKLKMAIYHLGRALYETGRYDAAIARYNSIVKDFPDDNLAGNVFFWRGRAYQRKEDWDSAIQSFKASEKRGGDIAVRAQEATAFSLFQKGEPEAAAKAYYDLIIKGDGKALGLERGIYLWTSDFHTNAGHPERALDVLNVMERSFPGGIGGEALYMMGENYRLLGKNKEAVSYFNKALEEGLRTPRKERCFLGLGQAYAALGERDKAARSLESALSGEVDNVTGAMARMEMGDLYAGEKNYQEAGKQYAMVAILYEDPELTPEALFKAGVAFENAGRKEEAEKLFAELLEKYPESCRARRIQKEFPGGNGTD